MLRVTILHEPWHSSTGAAFLFPLHYHARALRARGIELRFTGSVADAMRGTDVLGITNRFCKEWWRAPDTVTAFLDRARRDVGRLLWFDCTESTGTTQFAVLPYVDRYIKMQALRDRAAYLRSYIGGRIFTDYYHRLLGVHEDDVEAHLRAPADPAHLHKVVVGWNSGLTHWGVHGATYRRIWHEARGWIPRWRPHRWTRPSAHRPLAISCRIGTDHPRAAVAQSRRALASRLHPHLQTAPCSRAAYFAEMRRARAVISPFGFGEICFRDFEATLCGAAVLKQDMGHVETWPNLWVAGETYLPLAWNFADLDDRIAEVLRAPQRIATIASEAQARYWSAVAGPAGRNEFCDRFTALVTADRVAAPRVVPVAIHGA